MVKFSQAAVLASLVMGGAALQSGTASAMPMIDQSPATLAHSETASGLQPAYWAGGYGWHHGWHRHWGGPRFYGYGYHRPYGWHRPFAWHRPWHRHYFY